MTEPLAILLLPAKLESFELAGHARDLLAIPRVMALEPARFRTPRFLRDAIPGRQARRLRLPGEPRLLVLYHPRQYPLARALAARYQEVELWYVRPGPEALRTDPALDRDDLDDLDQLAQERATAPRVLAQDSDPAELDRILRLRLRELEIISSRAFVPWARIQGLAARLQGPSSGPAARKPRL